MSKVIVIDDARDCIQRGLKLGARMILDAFPGGTIHVPGQSGRLLEDQPLAEYAADLLPVLGIGIMQRLNDWLHGDSDLDLPMSARAKDRVFGGKDPVEATTLRILEEILGIYTPAKDGRAFGRTVRCMENKALYQYHPRVPIGPSLQRFKGLKRRR